MRARPIVLAVAFVVAVNVLLFAVGKLLPSPSGPESSSYATAPHGFAAWAELLERSGHPVVRERRLPADVPADLRATAIVIDPDAVGPDDARALARYVGGGGRLVAGGPAPRWLRDIVGQAPAWRRRAPKFWNPAPGAAETGGIDTVETLGRARFVRTPGAQPQLTARGSSLTAIAHRGRGEVILLADSSPLQNGLLDHGANALLGLRLAGEPGRPVRFYESLHGYGAHRGLAALPRGWKLALAGLALAGLVWLFARSRRLGPPERTDSDTSPPRRLYVDAMAATLARTKAPAGAAEPLRLDALARLEARGVKNGDAPELAQAPGTDEQLVALGASAARLRGGGR